MAIVPRHPDKADRARPVHLYGKLTVRTSHSLACRGDSSHATWRERKGTLGGCVRGTPSVDLALTSGRCWVGSRCQRAHSAKCRGVVNGDPRLSRGPSLGAGKPNPG